MLETSYSIGTGRLVLLWLHLESSSSVLPMCPPPPGTSGPGQACPSLETDERRKRPPVHQCMSSPYLYYFSLTSQGPLLMTGLSLLLGFKAGHFALVRKASVIAYIADTMAPGNGGCREIWGHFCQLLLQAKTGM